MKACLIFTGEMKGRADDLHAQLEVEQHQVCMHEITQAVALVIKLEDFSDPGVKKCIDGAEVVMFLIPDNDLNMFGGLGQYAAIAGKRVVAVKVGEEIGKDLDSIADSLVGINSPEILKALVEKVWEGKAIRRIGRIKCQ
ncbi:hypothetical protein [Xanthomonas sp. WHRI 8932A]|uniref:hypothetical protein n=1 Tax=unclassified Xanthomonas TaxID=2643310 RepID=UPI002B229121|nr:hypothetical protein [Xanthomonas sp. WHRI 8932A]MEA9566838.1 hypothetical protein [Xanthomonas sp. WHRI 8932A]